MDTDCSRKGAEAQKSIQAKVFDELSVVTEIGLNAELLHDDFSHADDNLVASPSWHGGIGKVPFVRHHPAGKLADVLQFCGKLGARAWKFEIQLLQPPKATPI